MTGYSTTEIWIIIVALGAGTFVLRFSFLGLLGDMPLPPFLQKMLRYTPVAVLPGMVAPLVLWPVATGGETDLARLFAALATLFVGIASRSALKAIIAGALALVLGIWLLP